MLDQKSDETFVRAKRRAMNADRNLIDVVAVFVAKIKVARLRKIDLVRRDGEFATDHAPRLHVDLRPVKGGFVRNFDIVDPRVFQNVARHVLGLFPKLRFIDKFFAKLRWIVRRKTHQIFVDPEKLEVIQIHLVHRIELGFELLRRHVEMRIIHLQRAYPHKAEQLAALLVAITRPILRQPQRQIAIAARKRRKQLVMMRTVHRFEVDSMFRPDESRGYNLIDNKSTSIVLNSLRSGRSDSE